MANYLKHPLGVSSHTDEGHEMARPLTPRSDRARASYGSMLMSAQDIPGLCARGVKCVRHDGHSGACWPQDKEQR